MVLNAAVQMLREADELKQKILKFKSGTSMLQERGLWATQQQLQKIYQKVLVLDLDYALDKKVEQDLWNIGFKQQIEALQTISKDRKNPLRSEGQAMLSWVLQAAAGFYLCLLHQICTTFKLDLPFRRRASLLGWVEGWGAGGAGCAGARLPPPAAARYICQHCLVHLGDLARYRHNLRVAYTFYRHALVVSAHSGQPYNQLALVSWRRGRRLGALYWHVRSLLVRAPFPPAPNNLARTLRAAAANGVRSPRDLPVLGFPSTGAVAVAAVPTTRLDAHGYVSELIRAMHYVHTVEELDTAEAIVEKLNSSLTALVATDSFESMTLIKMAVVLIWLCTSSCEGAGDVALSALAVGERRAARLAQSLATAAVLALALPAHTAETPPPRTLPALVVWLQWICSDDPGATGTLGGGPALAASPAWAARPQLWPALAHVFNQLAGQHKPADKYERVPLPEDEELQGFLPLEGALRGLRFAGRAAWDAYGARQTADGQNGHDGPDDRDDRDDEVSCGISATCLSNSPSLEHRVRAHRLLSLARRLSAKHPERMQCSSEDGACHFTATDIGGAGAGALTAALAALAAGAADTHPPPDDEADSDDDAAANARPPPPIVISEADFREKVREKRVGILKPQGSLERAREERAMACTQDDLDDMADDSMKGEDKKEIRKPRVNIAMAAIMRKQEETNKQVKFVTPPPTPEAAAEQADSKEQDKPKVIQPKAIKSLANLPIGRKTGGILSLKDKSAGYPHLVNADPEPKKEKEEKKEPKPCGAGPGPPQPYQPKRHEPPHWAGGPPAPAYEPRGFPAPGAGAGGYGPAFAPSYPPPGAGIRLPVVNPKEIDVRTAALQKQNSRQDLFPDGPKFAAHGYQISGDKKNFLNDLPPRFANQYRYWQSAQETQYGENKFRDDGAKAGGAAFGAPRGGGGGTGGGGAWPLDAFAAPPPAAPWWKPEAAPFAGPYPPPAYYSPPAQPPHVAHGPGPLANPYQTMPSYSQMQNQSIGQPSKPEGYGAGGAATLQGLASAPSFGGFGSYAPAAGYDAAMYPQFGKLGYQPMQMKMLDKPYGKELELGALPFGDPGLRAPALYGDPRPDINMTNNMDQNAGSSERNEAGQGSTYSLFSGAPAAAGWGQHHPHQSLWSGPGPSPLERLLEQQKQLKAPIAPAPHPAAPQ